MKKVKLLSLAMLSVVILLGTSCGKYEEGPEFTLLTKKMRLTGVWKIVEYVDADGNSENSNDNTTFEFLKDEKLIVKNGGISIDGAWLFVNDKQDLRMTYGQFNFTYNIIRLSNKQLWLSNDDNEQIRYEKQ